MRIVVGSSIPGLWTMVFVNLFAIMKELERMDLSFDNSKQDGLIVYFLLSMERNRTAWNIRRSQSDNKSLYYS
jgi:hypothetical protein